MFMKQRFTIILTCVLLMWCSSLATASVQLEFATSVGGDTGSLYLGAGNSMYFSFGDMVLLGMPAGSPLDGAYLELSDVRIDSKIQDFSNPYLNSALYDITVMDPAPELRMYSSGGQLIMTGFMELNTLLTVGTSGFIALEMDYEVSGIQLFGFSQSMVPDELQAFLLYGIADIKIEMSKAGTDFTSFIDSKNNINNIQVTTTLTAVPEPGVAALFIFGAVWFARRIRKN